MTHHQNASQGLAEARTSSAPLSTPEVVSPKPDERFEASRPGVAPSGVSVTPIKKPPRDLITHPKCGRSWSGLTRAHCPACCRTFSCDSAADRHRKGAHGIDRHCVDPATVGLVAVTKPWGQMWQNPAPEEGHTARRGPGTQQEAA